MQYLGGKTRLAKTLVQVMLRDSGIDPTISTATDACCGGLSMSVALVKAGFARVVAFDDRLELVNMWNAALAGWDPPEELTEDEYARLREAGDPENPLTAFAMFGCSFGAMAWQSYAKNARGDNYARAAARGIRRKVNAVRGKIEILRARYESFDPPKGLRYIDPPYANTTGYRGIPYTPVWPSARTWGAYVSEYSGPADFDRIWSKPARVDQMAKSGSIEGLFRLARGGGPV